VKSLRGLFVRLILPDEEMLVKDEEKAETSQRIHLEVEQPTSKKHMIQNL